MNEGREKVKKFFHNAQKYERSRRKGGVHYQVQHVVRLFERILPKYESQWKVLEVAAGTGHMTLAMLHANYHLIASDVNEPMLDILQDKVAELNFCKRCKIQVEDIFSLSFADESFDFVVCIKLIPRLHSLNDQRTALHEVIRVLKPGGKILFDYRNSWSFHRIYRSKKANNNLISPSEMSNLLDSLKLKVVTRRSTHFLAKKIAKKTPLFITKLCSFIDRILEKRWLFGRDIFVLAEKIEQV